MRLILTALVLVWAIPVQAANLCVKTGGSDGTVKASIIYVAGNEAASTCWQTIGRGVWGNATRTTPSSAQAVAAGDTVFVFGGTYDYALVLDIDEFEVLYDPVNSGTVGNLLTITCVGTCTLTANQLSGPIAGSGRASTVNNYIKWYADISQGHAWVIASCGAIGSCPAGSVKYRTDTGPVICHGTGNVLEGFTITSVVNAASDNYNAIKIFGCDDGLIQNNDISGFAIDISSADDAHASCFQVYQSIGTHVRHNRCRNSHAFVIFKDQGAVGNTGGGNRFYLNYVENVNACFTMSHADAGETASFFYQNICNGFRNALNIKTTHLSADEFVNNTFYDGIGSPFGDRGVWTFGGGAPTGMVMWNNIGLSVEQVIHNESAGLTQPGAADHQHSIWFTINDTFAVASEGGETFTFAQWLSGTTGDDEASPATTTTTDPLLANPAGGDFRHCTAAGVPHASCAGASPAINFGVDRLDLDGDLSTTDAINAGAYITGDEVIGLNGAAQGGGPATLGKGKGRMRMRGK